MLGIVDLHRFRISVLEETHPTCDIDPLIVDDHTRNASALACRWEALRRPPAWSTTFAVARRLSASRCAVQTSPPLRQIPSRPHTQNHQALLLANLHRVMDRPRPVVELGQRHSQQGVAQPQQPQPTGDPSAELAATYPAPPTRSPTPAAHIGATPPGARDAGDKHCTPTA